MLKYAVQTKNPKTEINQLSVFTGIVFILFMEKNHLNNLAFNCDTLDKIIQPTPTELEPFYSLIFVVFFLANTYTLASKMV